MGLLGMECLRNDPKTLPHPQDVGVNRKGVPAQAKEEETVNRLRPHPFQTAHHFHNVLRIHRPQEIEVQLPVPISDPTEDVANSLSFLFS